MAYTINKYNTTQLAVVEDGTINQTTDLKLVGKNYAGYGEIQNENFVFLLIVWLVLYLPVEYKLLSFSSLIVVKKKLCWPNLFLKFKFVSKEYLFIKLRLLEKIKFGVNNKSVFSFIGK